MTQKKLNICIRFINKLWEKYYWRGNPDYQTFKVEPRHIGKFCYIRVGIIPVEYIIKNIGKKKRFFGVRIPLSNKRIRCFAENVNCIACGREGDYFAVEKCKDVATKKYHLNLYSRTKHNQEIMQTIDHRIPKSRGGSNKPRNLQTMCSPCNFSKSDKMIHIRRKPKCKWKKHKAKDSKNND